ncbi:MAG: hypothetical protein ACI93R_001635 [Flavobacteriales bacterium]|jgi:uncharacterized protein YjbI with pentapeptide repeats
MSRDSELAEIVNLHKEWLKCGDTSGNRAGKRADLSGASLDGVDLSGMDLSGALLCGASLEGANLSASGLYHADFSDANLKGANLTGATLVLTNFTGADLQGANLSGTNDSTVEGLGQNRRGPNFKDANLENALLSVAYCVASDFSGANLKGACLAGAKLVRANFVNSDLTDLDMSKANLVDANLNDCKLCGTNLQWAQLSGANLRSSSLVLADICGADLRSANLENCKVDGIKYNRKTQFRGIRVAGCYGSARFKRFAEDHDYIEEFSEAHPLAYFVWLTLTDCGRSLMRVVLWSLVQSVSFGIMYFSLGPHAFSISNPNGLKWDLFSAIYFSVVTFTTLGFGDITPNTQLAAAIVIVEVVIGYVMLGILISILANKVARRS